MKHLFRLVLPVIMIAAASVSFAFGQKAESGGKEAKSSSVPKLKTLSDSVAFFLGYNLSRELQASDVTLDPKVLLKGFEYAKDTANTISEETFQMAMRRFAEGIQEKEAAAAEAKAKAAKQKGEDFLAAKAKEAGYSKTESGLLFKTITAGTGTQATDTSTVVLHYEGKLTDGSVFDSSIDSGEPAEFNIGMVIKGFREGVAMMKAGGKYEIIIPSELGYGEEGAGGVIGPHEVLIFTIELLEVK